MLHCPLKFNSKTLDSDGELLVDQCLCEQGACAFWEPITGTCSVATVAIIRARVAVSKSERSI